MTRASPLPRVAEDAVFVDALDLAGRAHVVVDGPPLPGTALCLSHWPDADPPDCVAADTSAGIVVRYLDAESAGEPISAVTNNHYDEDGVLAIWLLLERPASADPRRALAVEAAEAGDFHTWRDPAAAQVALALMAMAERGSTPLPEVMRALSDRSGRDPAGAITAAVLRRVGRLLDDPERHRRLWERRWARVQADVGLLDAGEATIDDHPAVDLAVVRAPRLLDPLACYPRTTSTRVLQVGPAHAELVLRYETWVRYVSRPLAPRIDLAPLARRLSAIETAPATWAFDGVAAMTPRLSPRGSRGVAPSGIEPGRLVAEIVAGLAIGVSA